MMEPVKGQPAAVAVKGEFPPCAGTVAGNISCMFVGWTTVAHREDAERLAAEAVARGLTICAQVEGPIASHYRWSGKDIREEEFRICFKFLEPQSIGLERWLHESHPYTTPQWVVVRADHVGEKYLSWARSNPTHSTL